MIILKKFIKIITSLFIVITSCLYILDQNGYLNNTAFALSNKDEETLKTSKINNGNLKIYFLDVGQADSILLRENNKNVLIDAGNNEDGPKLVNYIKSLGIESFDYVIGTHPHEDHIGGMDDIINNFEIKKFYMPDAITTTKTFEDVLDALEENNLKFNTPEEKEVFKLDDASFKVVYVGDDKKDLNNTSIVLKLTYGNTSYLFTGDATNKTEKQILNEDIKVTVLKVGHHGSQYSSSNEFLDKVSPTYAIISVGKNNIYGHPKDITLKKLNKRNIKIYRTDEMGTIIISSDGNKISIDEEKTDTNG